MLNLWFSNILKRFCDKRLKEESPKRTESFSFGPGDIALAFHNLEKSLQEFKDNPANDDPLLIKGLIELQIDSKEKLEKKLADHEKMIDLLKENIEKFPETAPPEMIKVLESQLFHATNQKDEIAFVLYKLVSEIADLRHQLFMATAKEQTVQMKSDLMSLQDLNAELVSATTKGR